MTDYIAVSEAMSQAVNTYTVAPGLAGDASGQPLVPPGRTRLNRIIVAVSASIVAVGSAGGVILMRLTGKGVKTQQDLVVGIIREDTTSTGGSKFTTPYEQDNLGIEVNPGGALAISFAFTGVDPGTPEVAASLGFD